MLRKLSINLIKKLANDVGVEATNIAAQVVYEWYEREMALFGEKFSDYGFETIEDFRNDIGEMWNAADDSLGRELVYEVFLARHNIDYDYIIELLKQL